MKSPKEKAEELVKKFFNINDKELENKGCNPFIDRHYAKQCAIVAVEEILNLKLLTKQLNIDKANKIVPNNSQFEYWKEVKKEIKKL